MGGNMVELQQLSTLLQTAEKEVAFVRLQHIKENKSIAIHGQRQIVSISGRDIDTACYFNV